MMKIFPLILSLMIELRDGRDVRKGEEKELSVIRVDREDSFVPSSFFPPCTEYMHQA